MVRLTDRPAMTIAVDLGRKATKQTKTTIIVFEFYFMVLRSSKTFDDIFYIFIQRKPGHICLYKNGFIESFGYSYNDIVKNY